MKKDQTTLMVIIFLVVIVIGIAYFMTTKKTGTATTAKAGSVGSLLDNMSMADAAQLIGAFNGGGGSDMFG